MRLQMEQCGIVSLFKSPAVDSTECLSLGIQMFILREVDLLLTIIVFRTVKGEVPIKQPH